MLVGLAYIFLRFFCLIFYMLIYEYNYQINKNHEINIIIVNK